MNQEEREDHILFQLQQCLKAKKRLEKAVVEFGDIFAYSEMYCICFEELIRLVGSKQEAVKRFQAVV